MARYRVLKPISFLQDGKIIQIRKPGKAGYELPDEAAAALGDAVELIIEAPEEAVATETAVEPTPDAVPDPEVPPTPEKADETASATPSDAAPGGRVRGGKGSAG